MANGHGGARPNAGRKKKPIQEKILEGKTLRPEAIVLKVADNLHGEDMPPAKQYLQMQTKGAGTNIAATIYKETWEWLRVRGCEKLVNADLLQKYAMAESRVAQAEEAVNTFGFLAKHPTTGAPIASPFIKISLDYAKQSQSIWAQICTTIADHIVEYGIPLSDEDKTMESILATPPNRWNKG